MSNRSRLVRVLTKLLDTGVAGIVAVTILAIAAFLVTPLLYIFLPVFLPEGHDLDSVPSSDSRWIAVVRQEIRGAGVFSDPYYAVVLRPGTGWIGWLRQEKVFEVYGNQQSGEPAVSWSTPHELKVQMRPALAYKPRLQVESYRDVHIRYDVTYTQRSD